MKTYYIKIDHTTRLAYFEKYNLTSRIGIILIHGLAEHKGRYEYFFDKISDLNMSVFALDIRGHGESDGARGDIDNFNTFLSDLDLFIQLIKAKYPHLKLALLGHSLGGLIATGYVESYNTIDFLLLSNPLLEAPNLTKLFHVIPYNLLGRLKIRKFHSESKEMLDYSYKDPLANNYFTLRLLGSIFKEGVSYVSKQMGGVKLPILLLAGKSDPLIKTNNFHELLLRFGSQEKDLIIYENAKHRLLQSEQKNKVISDISIWLNAQIN